jgi:hypothetical protein
VRDVEKPDEDSGRMDVGKREEYRQRERKKDRKGRRKTKREEEKRDGR